jgi:hypothetical protein
MIFLHGAAATNSLGLTAQELSCAVCVTSGADQRSTLGRQIVELKHALAWQFALGGRPAGEAIRALCSHRPAMQVKVSAGAGRDLMY